MVISNLENGEGTIVLMPNCSASWRINKMIIAWLGGLTLITAFFLAMAGAWVILPFAGLEVGLLAYFMHRVCRATHAQQVLYLEADRVRLESGINQPVRSWQFPRQQIYLLAVEANHSLAARTLYLCDTRTQAELGEFLNKDDKTRLLELMASTGLRVRNRAQLQLDKLPA